MDDIQAAWAAVTARGAKPATAGAPEPHLIAKLPDHDLWMAFVEDSEGNLLGLMSEVRPPSRRVRARRSAPRLAPHGQWPRSLDGVNRIGTLYACAKLSAVMPNCRMPEAYLAW